MCRVVLLFGCLFKVSRWRRRIRSTDRSQIFQMSVDIFREFAARDGSGCTGGPGGCGAVMSFPVFDGDDIGRPW